MSRLAPPSSCCRAPAAATRLEVSPTPHHHRRRSAGDAEFSAFLITEGHCDPCLADRWNTIPLLTLVEKLPRVALKLFDARVRVEYRYVSNRLYRHDFSGLDFGEAIDGCMSPIEYIVSNQDHELLKHKLLVSYFQTRWEAFGRRALVRQLLEYCFDLLVLTGFCLAFKAQITNDEGGGDDGGSDDSGQATLTLVFAALLLIVVLKNFAVEGLQWYSSKKMEVRMHSWFPWGRRIQLRVYWLDLWNVMDLLTYTCGLGASVSVLLVSLTHGASAAHSLGEHAQLIKGLLMIALVLFWSKILKLLSIFQAIGPSVRTIFRMFLDLAKFFSFFSIFWISFSLVWYVRFPEELGDNLWKVHLLVLGLTVLGDAGELPDLVYQHSDDVVVQVLWACMLLLMPLMLCNLLIAMMGNSYEIVQYRALDEWRLLWVSFVLDAQASLPPAKVDALLAMNARMRFHNAPVENATALDTQALEPEIVGGQGFNKQSVYLWDNCAEEEKEEETINLIVLKNELLTAVSTLEGKLDQALDAIYAGTSSQKRSSFYPPTNEDGGVTGGAAPERMSTSQRRASTRFAAKTLK